MNRSGDRKINLEYQLENFDYLREIILERARNRTTSGSVPVVFYRPSWILIPFVGIGLFFGWLAYVLFRGSKQPEAWVALGFALLVAFILLIQPVAIRILDDRVIFQYVCWRKSIGFDKISRVTLQNVCGSHDARIPTVIIERINGRPIKVAGLHGGSIGVYEALLSVWKKSRTKWPTNPR
jgi:hypothetical protein